MNEEDKKIYPFRVFTILVLGFVIGVLSGSYFDLNFQKVWLIMLIFLVALVLTALLNFIYKNRALTLINWALIFIFLGVGYYSYFDQKSDVLLDYDKELEIEGKVVKKVDRDYKKQKITVEIIDTNSEVDMSGINILVNAPHYPEYSYGDKVKFVGEIVEPGLFEDFDYGIYLRRYMTFGVVYKPNEFEKSGCDSSIGVRAIRSLYSVSDLFEKSLNRVLTEPHASLASGLILGVRRNIPDDFLEALNITGLTHIIALSGYNVTIIVAALSFVLLPYLGRKKVFWFGLVLVLSFVILTGAASSVVRAAIFSMLIIFARTIGRQGDQINLMLLAAFIMIILNPYVLRDDLGFQLSFMAFSGLIFISPIIEKMFKNKKIRKIPDIILLPLRETLSAQIAVTPLILIAFGRISFIAPISNLLVLGVIPLTMSLVFIAGLGGIIYYPLGKFLGTIAWPTLKYIVVITKSLSRISFASGIFEGNMIVFGFLFYIVLFFLVIMFRSKYKIIY